MKLKNYYWLFPKAIDSGTCKKIIELGLEQTPTVGTTQGTINDARSSKVSWLGTERLYNLLTPYLEQANQLAEWQFDWDYCELLQFTQYDAGDRYDWHTDGGSDHAAALKRYIYGVTNHPLKEDGTLPKGYITNNNMVGKVRKLSLTLTLSDDDYDGGDFEFNIAQESKLEVTQCKQLRERGSIVVFPSFVSHRVTPITRGTRNSLVMWALGRPFK